MSGNEDGDDEKVAEVIHFPQSRVLPTQSFDPLAPEKFGMFAQLFDMPREQTNGHWCSHCRGIWFGYLLEVTCPACGNRHG